MNALLPGACATVVYQLLTREHHRGIRIYTHFIPDQAKDEILGILVMDLGWSAYDKNFLWKSIDYIPPKSYPILINRW
ncbi:hypothetical protein [Paenibacillus lacisoli]|uniref:hypothetical protein n=1 Tax=Paenibacillus lacisoli TaxID=3064525 RepID=UPI002729C454|nr:hypothetical protein [Paenibacillus sp. JX-17]